MTEDNFLDFGSPEHDLVRKYAVVPGIHEEVDDLGKIYYLPQFEVRVNDQFLYGVRLGVRCDTIPVAMYIARSVANDEAKILKKSLDAAISRLYVENSP